MKLFSRYLAFHKMSIAIALCARFASSIADLLIPKILATMIDEIAIQKNVKLTLTWGGYMLLVSLISAGLTYCSNFQASKILTKIGKQVRTDLFAKTMTLSASQIDRLTIGSLETRLTSDTYNVQQVIGMMLRIGVRAPILLIGSIMIALTLDPVLACIIIVALPIIAVCIYCISKRGITLYQDVQKNEDIMASLIRENVLGIRVIKALVAKWFEVHKFKTMNQDLTGSDIRATTNMALSNPLITMILNVTSVFVILAGAYRISGGYCDIGVLLAFITYFTIILGALMSISRIFIMTTKGLASGSRIEEVLELELDLKVEKSKKSEDAPYISFEQVDFSYSASQIDEKSTHEMNLQDISFSLNKGDTLGIIGATGSGKSTLLLLLMRFYDVTTGGIYIDGRNVKSILLEELHRMFGVALQSDYLFSDTILENISFGRDLPMEQVEESVKIAQAQNFVETYDNTYEHKLTIKGSNLSGGQKQRLLIARAVAGSPDILILDDSSSALDYKTDAMLRQELNKVHKDTTTIMVAQRISSIKDANLIMMLDQGKIVDIGQHEDLMKRCTPYRELSIHQLGVLSEYAG